MFKSKSLIEAKHFRTLGLARAKEYLKNTLPQVLLFSLGIPSLAERAASSALYCHAAQTYKTKEMIRKKSANTVNLQFFTTLFSLLNETDSLN